MLFLIGFFAQTGQILIFREVMALFHGTELLFGSILGASVLWTAVGVMAAESFLKWRTRRPLNFNPLNLLAFSTLLNAFVLVLQIYLLRLYPLVFTTGGITQAFSFYGVITVVFFISFPFAFLMGAQFTLCLWANPRERLGFLYRAESIGAMVGGMLISFVLVDVFFPFRIVYITGLLFVAGLYFILKSSGISRSLRFIQIAVIFILVFLLGFPLDLNRFSLAVRPSNRESGFSLMDVRESRYGRVEVFKNPRAHQFMVYHNSALVSSIEPIEHAPGLSNPSDLFEKHLADICLTQHPGPAHVLLIGGSLSRLPEHMLTHGVGELKIVELDPVLIDMFETYSGISRKEKKIKIIPEDGRSFIFSEPENRYDLVIVFSGEPDNASVNRFCTKEFFTQVNRVLKPDGVFCLFLPTHGAAHEYLSKTLIRRSSSVYKAMKSVYKYVSAVQAGGHLLMASQWKNQVFLDPAVLGKRLSSRTAARPFYRYEERGELREEKIPEEELPAYFSSLFGGVLEQESFFSDSGMDGDDNTRTQISIFQKRLEASTAKINLDAYPAAVTYSMKVWEGITASDSAEPGEGFLSKVLDLFGEGNLKDIIILPGIFIGTHFIIFFIVMFPGLFNNEIKIAFQRTANNYSLLLAALITGCFSITLEIILLSLYQSLTGYLYYRVGILLAVFMGGLAIGAKITDRPFKSPKLPLSGILLSMVFLCFLTGCSSPLLSDLKSGTLVNAVFICLMLMNGILCGAAFPVLGFLTCEWKRGRPGAWIYAFDLIGAGIGAFFIAPFLIPAAGMQNTLVILGLLIFSLAILVLCLRPRGAWPRRGVEKLVD